MVSKAAVYTRAVTTRGWIYYNISRLASTVASIFHLWILPTHAVCHIVNRIYGLPSRYNLDGDAPGAQDNMI